jgi:acyl dehydratase
MGSDCSVVAVDDPRPYRVRAHNAAIASDNKIHDDEVARRHGFRGGLVPGVTVFAYMTRPVVETVGRAWLERGTMSVKFIRPFYEGDLVTVTATRASAGGLDLTATDKHGAVGAVANAAVSASSSSVELDRYVEAALPEERVPATPKGLAGIDVLGSLEFGFHADRAHGFLGQLEADLEVYDRDGLAHPGWLLRAANDILAANVRLGPWIHSGSVVRNLGVVTDGDRISARGRVARLWERNGHQLVELDVLLVADGHRPVTHVGHTAIYRLRDLAE